MIQRSQTRFWLAYRCRPCAPNLATSWVIHFTVITTCSPTARGDACALGHPECSADRRPPRLRGDLGTSERRGLELPPRPSISRGCQALVAYTRASPHNAAVQESLPRGE